MLTTSEAEGIPVNSVNSRKPLGGLMLPNLAKPSARFTKKTKYRTTYHEVILSFQSSVP